MKKSCGIYKIINKKGRKSYKIFASQNDLKLYLEKYKDKTCLKMEPIFSINQYQEYPHTEARKLTPDYLKKRL